MGNWLGYLALGGVGYSTGALLGLWGGDIGPDKEFVCACKEGIPNVCGQLHVRQVAPVKKTHRPVVFIHGMWHGPWFFETAMQKLKEQGVPTFVLDLDPKPFKTPYGEHGYIRQIDQVLCNIGADKEPVILVGHSQGGTLVQMMLKEKPQYFCGAALVATVPLSCGKMLTKEIRNAGIPETDILREMGFFGGLYFTITGRILNKNIIRRLFLLPETKEVTNFLPGGLKEYYSKLMRAPSDGWPSILHWFQGSPSFKNDLPMLLVFADKDIIFPYPLVRPVFKSYFPNAKELLVENQSHCFIDPGWEASFLQPFVHELTMMAQRT